MKCEEPCPNSHDKSELFLASVERPVDETPISKLFSSALDDHGWCSLWCHKRDQFQPQYRRRLNEDWLQYSNASK